MECVADTQYAERRSHLCLIVQGHLVLAWAQGIVFTVSISDWREFDFVLEDQGVLEYFLDELVRQVQGAFPVLGSEVSVVCDMQEQGYIPEQERLKTCWESEV